MPIGIHARPLVIGDTAIVVNIAGIERRRLTGEFLWHHPLMQYVPVDMATDGHVLLVSEAKTFALDVDHGKLLWTLETDGQSALGTPAIAGDIGFVGTDKGIVYAISLRSGKVRWAENLGDAKPFKYIVRAITALGSDIYVSGEKWLDEKGLRIEGRLLRLRRRDGFVVWSYSTEREQPACFRCGFSSQVSNSGDTLFVSDLLGNSVRAISRRTGALLWIYKGKPGYAGFSSPPVVGDKFVYAGSGDTTVVRMEKHRGVATTKNVFGSVYSLAKCGDSLVVNLWDHSLIINGLEREQQSSRSETIAHSEGASKWSSVSDGSQLTAFGQEGIIRVTCSLATLP